jgi:hypothetical protein
LSTHFQVADVVGNGIDAFGFHENSLTLKRQNYTVQHLLDACHQEAFFAHLVSMGFFACAKSSIWRRFSSPVKISAIIEISRTCIFYG